MAVPAAIGLFMLAGPSCLTLMHHGSFSLHKMRHDRRQSHGFCLGLAGFYVD